jgi:hypothetical protein
MLLSLKRAVRVCATVAGWLLFNFAISYLLSIAPSIPYAHIFGPDFPEGVLALVLLSGNLLVIPIFLIYYRHRRRDRWIQEEADRWLARRARKSTGAMRWRGRLVRKVLWIPSLFALAAFLFLPEALGMGLHLIFRGTADLNGHHIEVPITWWAFAGPHATGDLYLVARVGKGIGRVGFLPYWRHEPPLSSMGFYAISDPANDHSHDKPPAEEIVVSKRVLPFGGDALTCWELAVTADVIRIDCVTSSNDFTAGFGGERADVSAFYKVLETATHTK